MVFVPFWLSVVFPEGMFMVKLERDADEKVPRKVMNIDIDTMIALMASNILSITVSIIVNGLYIID